MTKTQYYVAASLDGFIADRENRLDWLLALGMPDDIRAHYEAFLANVGALAMGSRTYEFVHAMGGDWPYAGLPTWVFTHRPLPAFPGADLRFTAADVAQVHADMVSAARGRNVWLVGGGDLVAQFARRGLLDELWLGVVPVVLGGGVPLLPAPLPGPLELLEVTRFAAGLVELRYRVPR
jgi:dihydrofolate reductase